VKNLLNRERT